MNRRRFLAGTAVTAGLAAVTTACRSGGGGGTPAGGDLGTAASAARLERLLVETYTTTRVMLTQGKLGALVPPAVAGFVTTAAGQHQAHMDAWNKLLTAAGGPAVTDPDQKLRPVVDAAVARVADIPAAATLALRLEDYASQTYLKAIPALTTAAAVELAARILVVDQQHQAVLRYLLGLYPVGSGVVRDPGDFAPADPRPSLITG